MKLKYKQFTKLIKWFIVNFPDYRVEYSDTDFECDIDEEIVYIPREMEPREIDALWKEKVLTGMFGVTPWLNVSELYAFSLLHEIGHLETAQDVKDNEDVLRELLQLKELDLQEIHTSNIPIAYWNLPSEYLATDWAVSFYHQNRKEYEELFDIFHLRA
jgi:hypothetical protein